ncbi:YqeB family protein [Actinopolymorpha rutila]|uniref:DUF308 domain-containing protein n=1 Tax=Actinopolymorpha rutila TaxID=446787 RepID=A0A852ZII9_9ACTN|nr:hypothetical protein [Actinopolymorpha rutila]NYH88920.1 hypothetical protein [Actinopolymorpha rutila]
MTPRTTDGAVVVGRSVAERALVWVGFPALGAGVGWLLRGLVVWVVTVPHLPLPGLLRFVATVPEPWLTLAGLGAGAVAGGVLVVLGERDYVTVTVDHQEVGLAHAGERRSLRREQVGAVFLDGKQLVLLDRSTGELARQRGDLPDAGRIEAAFSAYGYPWRAGDPHREEFRPWVDDAPDLPAAAHATLRARRRALAENDDTDADELRTELGRLGVVVRDEHRRQYWRRVRPTGGPHT